MDLYTQEKGHQKGHGLFLNPQRDSTNRELYVDLTGDNAGSLQPGVTYNLALWGESRDYQAYTDSEEVVIENFLSVSGERLAAPGNIIIDETTLEVSWDPVDDPNLLDYQLNVYYSNGQTNPRSVSFKNTRETHASINSDVLDHGNGTYYVTVRARAIDVTKKANGIANPDAPGSQAGEDAWNALPHAAITVSDTPLPTISLAGSSWGTDGFLRWDPVEGASSYEVQTYRRTSAQEEFKEGSKKIITPPVFIETTPTTPRQEEIAVRVRAISANAAEHANGEWSDLSPVYTYSDAPVLPSLKKKFNREDLTISWELITGEDAAYVDGYVVEIRFSETDSVGNSISVQPGWTVITEGNTVSSVPLSAFAKYLGSYKSAGSAAFNVWAYSSDLSARNNGKNNSSTRLPEGVLNALESTPRLTLSDITRKDGRCSFLVSISGNCDNARLFTVVYKSSGMMRRVQVLDAEQTVPVTLTGLGQNDRISVILVDENARPLTSVTPVE